MTTIIPAILEKTFEDIQKKVELIKPHAQYIQLDVMDGAFVPNETFRDPARIRELDIEMEVHLMIEKPSFFIPQWALPNVARMIVHFEAMGNVEHEISLMRNTGKEVAIAINPDTSTYEIKDYLDKIDMVVVMAVEPGFSGQQFQKDVLEKVKEVKNWAPNMLVEVDGGVNGDNARMIVDAGADILALNSYLWQQEDLGATIQQLQQLS